jgi:hypothetical protein
VTESTHATAERKRGPAERKAAAPGLGERQPDVEPGPVLDDGWTSNLEGRHAALLADTRLSGEASRPRQVRLLQGLQRGYGNGHVARVLQRVADCPAPPLEKPKLEPTDDPKFNKVESRVNQVAATEKKHAPAKAKVAEAQGAALPPANDTASQAAAAQVDTMAAQKPGTFNKQAFIAAVRKAIEAASPKNMDEADNFKESGKAEAVKEQVGGLVTKGKDDSQQAIKQSTDAAPDASKATPKPVTAMPDEQPGKPPIDVGAAGAMPSPKSVAEVNLASGPCEIDSQMADANVTEDQLKKSNEPEFTDAVDAKQKTEEHAATAPQEYRAQEQQTLDKEKAEAAAGASSATAAMHVGKVGAANKVGADKSAAKAKDEAARAQVAKQIEDIYNRAKSDVTKILADLDPLVDKTFKEGEEAARNEFTSFVKTKTDAYKDDRYSGVLGWGRWLKDKFKTNPDLNKIIDDGRAKYMARMDVVIGNVADIIGRELTRAKDRIAQGRTEVKEYVAKLPKDLKQAGAEGQTKIDSQFDQLESDVTDKQDGLVQTLAQKYTAARDALDEEANKMKEDNKGLVDKAKDAVVGVIQTILKLKDMLLGVLAKAAGAIGKIIKDPIGFLGNLVNAIKSGLSQFVSNIGTHLKKGLMGWLFGALGEAGIQLPESFDLKGILSLILQVLGLTYDNIRGIAVRLVGEKIVAAAEGTVKVLMTLVKEGPAGLWEWIKDKIAEINIKEMVMGAIKDFVITKIITAGVTWLIGFLNPAAAFIKACKMIYDIIMFFIERGSQIMEFVNSILDGIGAIAAGSIGAAANLVENSLAKILPLAISFLAAALGVGGIGEKIKEIIEKIRAPITKLVTAVLGPILRPLKKLYDKGAKWVKGKVDQGKAWVKGKVEKGKAWAKSKVEKGKAWVKGKVGGAKAKAQERREAKSDTEKVKGDALRELASRARGIVSIEAFAALRKDILSKYASRGLKSLTASLGGGAVPAIQVSAKASPTSKTTIQWSEVFAPASEAEGDLLQTLKKMEEKFAGTNENTPPEERLAVWGALSVDGKPVGPMQQNEPGGRHAEELLLANNWGPAMEAAKRAVQEQEGPVRVIMSLTASPCARCSSILSAHLAATRAQLSGAYASRIQFSIASKGAYEKSEKTKGEEKKNEFQASKKDIIKGLKESEIKWRNFTKKRHELGKPMDEMVNLRAEEERLKTKITLPSQAEYAGSTHPAPTSTKYSDIEKLLKAGWDMQVLVVAGITESGQQLETGINNVKSKFKQANAV